MATDPIYCKLDLTYKGNYTAQRQIDRINKLCTIIDTLENTALTAVGNGDVVVFELNNGQSTQKTEFRDPDQIAKAIEYYDTIVRKIIARLTPAAVRMVDSKNIKRFL